MIKCVIFDMDATIADTLPLCIEAFKRTVYELTGKTPSSDEITATFGPNEVATIKAFAPDSIEEGTALYLKKYTELHPVMCPDMFDGMKEVFELLEKNGVKCALVTGKGKPSLDVTLRQFGLENTFSHIEPGHPEKINKTANINTTLETLGIQRNESIYVGDAVTDIICAKNAGIRVISAAWSKDADVAAIKQNNPDFIAYTTKELYGLLENMISGK